jgi:hypothetical protein
VRSIDIDGESARVFVGSPTRSVAEPLRMASSVITLAPSGEASTPQPVADADPYAGPRAFRSDGSGARIRAERAGQHISRCLLTVDRDGQEGRCTPIDEGVVIVATVALAGDRIIVLGRAMLGRERGPESVPVLIFYDREGNELRRVQPVSSPIDWAKLATDASGRIFFASDRAQGLGIWVARLSQDGDVDASVELSGAGLLTALAPDEAGGVYVAGTTFTGAYAERESFVAHIGH